MIYITVVDYFHILIVYIYTKTFILKRKIAELFDSICIDME